MARIVLATIGSLGDLHPFIAIGQALAAQGEQVLLAVPEDGLAKVRAAGLEASPILPSYIAVCAELGLSPEQAAAKIITDPDFVMDELLMPSMHESARALDVLAADADVMATSTFAFAAQLIAEKHGLPLAETVLQPMCLFSAWQPPNAARFELFRKNPRGAIGHGWNRALFALARTIVRRRYARQINAVRAEHGLRPSKAVPLLDHGATTQAVLCCWSEAVGTLPPDAPESAVLTGFPFFDSDSGAEEVLAPELDAFLKQGDAPLIFTLGSVVVAAAGQFYAEAAAASRALGKRALMLTGQPGPPRLDGDCLTIGYAPHSAVFPRAAAVIHHGGIGTIGQALRAGKPQVIVPHFGDQFDNAARLKAAGIGLSIRPEKFYRAIAARTLSRILAAPNMTQAGERVAQVIAGEDGAGEAARRIAALAR